MKNYLTLYGPINGMVCIGLGLFFFALNVLLIELEDTSMAILMLAPIPLVLTGISFILFPGIKLSRKEVDEQNVSFFAESPKHHKFIWILFGLLGVLFLVLQLLSLLDFIALPLENCFLSKYLGIGGCAL